MAGLLGMAVLASIQKLTCPRKTVQARAQDHRQICCKKCKKPFSPAEGVPVKKHR
jgi:hypothetical protein